MSAFSTAKLVYWYRRRTQTRSSKRCAPYCVIARGARATGGAHTCVIERFTMHRVAADYLDFYEIRLRAHAH